MDKTYSITISAERKRGQHLGAEERGIIQELKKLGYSNRAIAREINCSPSTVGYELRRGTPIMETNLPPFQNLRRSEPRSTLHIPIPHGKGQSMSVQIDFYADTFLKVFLLTTIQMNRSSCFPMKSMPSLANAWLIKTPEELVDEQLDLIYAST